MRFRHLALVSLAVCTVTSAQAVISWIEDSRFPAISGNGRYLFLRGDRWDPYTGRTSVFGNLQPYPGFVVPTYDGEKVFMEAIVGEEGQTQIFGVTKTTATPLSNDGGTNATPFGCSYDGSVVIGEVLGATMYPGYVWTNGNAVSFSDAIRVISGNGKVMFGELSGSPTRWDETGPHDFWTDEWVGNVTDTNHNGTIAVGTAGNRAFKWTAAGGFTDLGHLPLSGNVRSEAHSVSNDGSIITGASYNSGTPSPFVIVNGTMMSDREFFTSRGMTLIDRIVWLKVSENGQVLYGVGIFGGKAAAFHAYIAGDHLSLNLRGDSRRVSPGKSIFGQAGFVGPTGGQSWIDLESNSPNIVVPTRTYSGNIQGKVLVGTPAGRYTITARRGDKWVSRDLSVLEPIANVQFETDRIHGGKSAKVIVTLANPATQRVEIRLSSNKAGLNLASTVVIPRGATQGVAYIGTFGRLDLAAFDVVAQGEFHTAKSAKLYVYPTIGWLTSSPTSVKGGQSATGRIGTTLAAPASGLNYSLRSLSSLINVPASASIAFGTTSTAFSIQTSPVTVTAMRSIEASSAGVSRTATITLTP